MESKKKKKSYQQRELSCHEPYCFFCTMKEPDPSLRAAQIAKCFQEMPLRDDQEQVLVLSGLWKIAMTHPDDPEFPALGVFECMASLIRRGVNDREWLMRDQNIYIPYYAAHIIGSYTMNVASLAEKAVKSGVVPPLMNLLGGEMSWVEQRVAVRALGHLAGHDQTFEAIAQHEAEIVELCMDLASKCLDVVYTNFFTVTDGRKRLKYHCDLLTRGMGGLEMEYRKAEEWASQLQCWSLYILSCFAIKERSLDLICRQGFLKDLCKMWGGLVYDGSPAGVGLLRVLCYTPKGRKFMAGCKEVLERLCNLSRSSDEWQYMGIDSLLLLIKDPDTRSAVMEISAPFLADLVELRDLGVRKNVGDSITRALLQDYSKSSHNNSTKLGRALESVRDLKVERKKREKKMSNRQEQERVSLAGLVKKQGTEMFWRGEVQEAVRKYSEALELCPLKRRKERGVFYSNRAQCYLILREVEAAISDATKALCLSNPANSHKKSLWRRSQAYDLMGLARESLMDCILFVHGCFPSKERKRVKVPYYATRMINKQMNATWLFAAASSKESITGKENVQLHGYGIEEYEGKAGEDDIDKRGMKDMERLKQKQRLTSMAGLSPILEEHSSGKGQRKTETSRRKKYMYKTVDSPKILQSQAN